MITVFRNIKGCLLLLTLVALPHFLWSQEIGRCGNPQVSVEDYQAFQEQLQEFAKNRKRLDSDPALKMQYEIPIHLYVINDDEGNPPTAVASDEEAIIGFDRGLIYVKENLHSQISFYICQVDIVNDSEIYDEQSPTAMTQHIEDNYPSIYDNNTLRVFLNNEQYGVGAFPSGVKFKALKYPEPAWLLHEFGHYFGLYHTFHGVIGQGGCGIALYPDHSPNHDCPPWYGFPDCENMDYGNCYGDLVADTPVDVYCEGVHLADLECIREVNGEEYAFHPDYNNAMSYWHSTRRRISTGQKQRVIDILENEELGVPPYGGDMSFLIDGDTPECDYDVSYNLFPPAAYVDQAKYNSDLGDFDYVPYKHGLMLHNGVFVNIRKGIYYISGHLSEDEVIVDFSANNPGNIFLDPIDDGYLNADYNVNVSDIIRIREHILGENELEKPYNWIAADVNNSGTITTFDLIHIRKVLLGITSSFNIPSWRFVPKYALNPMWEFSNDFMDNPFTAVWDDGVSQRAYKDGVHSSYLGGPSSFGGDLNTSHFPFDLENMSLADESNTWSFIAVKTGDVTNVGEGDGSQNIEMYNSPITSCLEPNREYTLSVKIATPLESVEGIQLEFELATEKLSNSRLNNQGVNITSANDLFRGEDKVRLVWVHEDVGNGRLLEPGETVFELDIKPSEMICNLDEIIGLSRSGFNLVAASQAQASIAYSSDENIDFQLSVSEKQRPHQLIRMSPNPVGTNMITGEVLLGSEIESGSIHLFDVFGNSKSIDLGRSEAGLLELPTINIDDLAPGFIYYNLQLGVEMITGFIVKI